MDAGLVRNIGISNFNAQLIYDLLTYARYCSRNGFEIEAVREETELHLARFNAVHVLDVTGTETMAMSLAILVRETDGIPVHSIDFMIVVGVGY